MARKASKKVAKKVSKKVSKKISKKTAKKTAKKSAARKISGPYDLVVVESPHKAKTIRKYLGRGFQVVASNGHIKDLPKSKLGVDTKKNFAIDLVPIASKQDKVQRIQELAKRAGHIYLAPDMDREGEAIAYHLAEEIGRKKKIHRIVFNAVTKSAIQEAISHPMTLRQEMYDSQKTRRILDRLVGYKISPILWDKVQRGISAGRVQSVALRLIVEREDEIRAFKPERWFSIEGIVEKRKIPFEIRYYGEQANKKNRTHRRRICQKHCQRRQGQNLHRHRRQKEGTQTKPHSALYHLQIATRGGPQTGLYRQTHHDRGTKIVRRGFAR